MLYKMFFGLLSPLKKIFVTRYNLLFAELNLLSAQYAGLVVAKETGIEIVFYFPLTVIDVATQNFEGIATFKVKQDGIFCSFNKNTETRERFAKLESELDNRDSIKIFTEGLRQITEKNRETPYHISMEFSGDCDTVPLNVAIIGLKHHFKTLKEQLKH